MGPLLAAAGQVAAFAVASAAAARRKRAKVRDIVLILLRSRSAAGRPARIVTRDRSHRALAARAQHTVPTRGCRWLACT